MGKSKDKVFIKNFRTEHRAVAGSCAPAWEVLGGISLTWLRLRISYLKQAFFFGVRLGCAQLNGALFCWLSGEDRVEKETESELSHWFQSGEDLECFRRSN
jgi:hypothetical protein